MWSKPASVSRTSVARRSSVEGQRATRPRFSSRDTTCDSRGREAFVAEANTDIRRVCSSVSDSIAMTM
jgi:hypothetical protein